MAKVAVTGASGKAGRAVVRGLLEHDQDVLALDVVAPAESPAPSLIADLTDFGQTVECLAGAEAVVHLAAIPSSGIHTEETTFRTNMLSTYNVFEAARLHEPTEGDFDSLLSTRKARKLLGYEPQWSWQDHIAG